MKATKRYAHQLEPQENQCLARRPELGALIEELEARLKAVWKAARPA